MAIIYCLIINLSGGSNESSVSMQCKQYKQCKQGIALVLSISISDVFFYFYKHYLSPTNSKLKVKMMINNNSYTIHILPDV